MLARARRRKFRKGEVICHEGDPADTLHLIVKGRVAVRATSPLGSVVTTTVLDRGRSFGEVAIFDEGARRSATVAALEPTETMSLFRDEVNELRQSSPSVNEALMLMLRDHVERLTGQLVEALYLPVEQRVLRRLAELVDIYDDGDDVVEIPLTQEDIATMAGTTRPTANGVLRELETAGVVELTRGKVRVLEPSELR